MTAVSMDNMINTKSRSLIQIVPSLSPVIDGIGDYALQLARELRKNCGVETSFVVCDPAWPRSEWNGEFHAVGLARRSASLLWGAMYLLALRTGETNSPILLHFSPYGYQKRGCPLWLVSALDAVAKKSLVNINVAFHELDVNRTRPWSSTYWVPGLQRRLIQKLAGLAAFSYTNTGVHQEKLDAWGAKGSTLIPNFSNMGEAHPINAGMARARQIVIFGRADQRRWTYEKGGRELVRLCRHLAATRIIDIGSPIPGHTCEEIGGVPVERRGVQPAEAVGEAMRNSLASFMYYPVPLLTKSGVHALACASGTIPFVATNGDSTVECPGLLAGVDYVVLNGEEPLPSLPQLEQLAPVIIASYEKRSLKVAARTIAENVFRTGDDDTRAAAFAAIQQLRSSGPMSSQQRSAFVRQVANQEVGL